MCNIVNSMMDINVLKDPILDCIERKIKDNGNISDIGKLKDVLMELDQK